MRRQIHRGNRADPALRVVRTTNEDGDLIELCESCRAVLSGPGESTSAFPEWKTFRNVATVGCVVMILAAGAAIQRTGWQSVPTLGSYMLALIAMYLGRHMWVKAATTPGTGLYDLIHPPPGPDPRPVVGPEPPDPPSPDEERAAEIVSAVTATGDPYAREDDDA